VFFRFAAAIAMIVAMGLTATALEKHNLELNRTIAHRQYRLELLREREARLRAEVQGLATPAALYRQDATSISSP
jgi:hypothetical protein